jgi:hypothetical protein
VSDFERGIKDELSEIRVESLVTISIFEKREVTVLAPYVAGMKNGHVVAEPVKLELLKSRDDFVNVFIDVEHAKRENEDWIFRLNRLE